MASGFGGFGAPAPAAGGFGAAAPAAGGFGKSTGFGTAGAGAGGFGATAPAAGGFGAAAPAAGGFGKSTGFGTAGAGAGGFGGSAGGGFGQSTFSAGSGFGTAAAAPPVPPYSGIRGVGNNVEWVAQVDFSTITDDTPFTNLPPVLQQHLLELRAFTKTEEDARNKLLRYLNDEEDDGLSTESAPTADKEGTPRASTVSGAKTRWRRLDALFAEAKSGDAAVDGVVARCARREQEAADLRTALEDWESQIRQYQVNVWEPLREQEPWRHGDRHRASPMIPRTYDALSQPIQDKPFMALLTELTQRAEKAGLKLRELQAAVRPGEAVVAAPGMAYNSYRDGTRASARDSSVGAAPNGVGAISQVNTALENELAALMSLSERTSHLQERAGLARNTFARLYGTAETNALFVRPLNTVGLHVGAATARRGLVTNTSPYQRLAHALRPLPPVTVPAPGTTASAPGAGSGGGFGSKPAASGFGTTGGFGSTGGFGASAPAAGGFGAKPTAGGFGAAAGTGAPAATGFGAAAGTGAPAATGFGAAAGAGAPAATGFGATNPAASPRSAPAGAPPSGFSLGPAAAAPASGDATVGDNSRPQRRGRF